MSIEKMIATLAALISVISFTITLPDMLDDEPLGGVLAGGQPVIVVVVYDSFSDQGRYYFRDTDKNLHQIPEHEYKMFKMGERVLLTSNP